MSATHAPEQHEFRAETRQLLELMIHSLYSHKEIFLRELVSNASDALSKRRVELLTAGDADALPEFAIELEVDSEQRTLTIRDNGIGMSREEVIENIGTIANSGTRRFLEQLNQSKSEDLPELIGQFGVGFYAAFMVADQVSLETRSATADKGVRWQSSGDGGYTLEEIERDAVGTAITLHLKDLPEGEAGAADFTQEWTLRETVRRYSDFVEYPIRMEVERTETPTDDEGKSIEGAEPVTTTEVVTLNSQKPLWTRPKSEITEDEHKEFYRHLCHDWNDPLDSIHFRAEGTTEYTALLYLPTQKRPGLFDPNEAKSQVQLYVRRVFITADCEELMPVWLRFVPGIVDSSDLPLNVSRETLQHARQLGAIQKRLTKKVIDAFAGLLNNRREDYDGFWTEFGPVIKEGLYYDDEHREALAPVCLFQSTREAEEGQSSWTSLAEYLERAADDQEAIYVLSAPDIESARRSPHLEAFAKRGIEVLLLTDHVDEFVLQRLTEFEGKPLRSIAKGESDLDTDEEKQEREKAAEEHAELLKAIQEQLTEHVSEVRFTGRLEDSPALLVSSEHDLAPHVKRAMEAAGQPTMGLGAQRTLELNPQHALVGKLEGLLADDPKRFGDYCQLLLAQAFLAEGSPVPDPAKFGRLVTELMSN